MEYSDASVASVCKQYEIFATPIYTMKDDSSKGDGGGESKTEGLLSDKSTTKCIRDGGKHKIIKSILTLHHR